MSFAQKWAESSNYPAEVLPNHIPWDQMFGDDDAKCPHCTKMNEMGAELINWAKDHATAADVEQAKEYVAESADNNWEGYDGGMQLSEVATSIATDLELYFKLTPQ